MEFVSSSASSPPPHPPPFSASSRSADCTSSGTDGGTGVGYIEHHVSKMDTLAGVAIKYGVEVADIKRMNNLVTDLQMFALKSLYIPLPGRHPPSSILSNGHDSQRTCNSYHTTPPRRHSGSYEYIKSLKLNGSSDGKKKVVSPAMSKLQGYYGTTIKPPTTINQNKDVDLDEEGFEMAVYSNGGRRSSSHHDYSEVENDGPFSSKPRKCKSIANGFLLENGELAADANAFLSPPAKSSSSSSYSNFGKWTEMLVKSREKFETDDDFTCRARERLLKEEDYNESASGGGFSATKGKGSLAMRVKTPIPPAPGLSDYVGSDGGLSSSEVRKSSSTPSLQDREETSIVSTSSMWPTSSKWSLKPVDHLPMLEGFPKTITGWRNKTALD